MTYYHAFIEYQYKDEVHRVVWFNATEAQVRTVCEAIKNNLGFWLNGRMLQPSQVERILVFCSSDNYNDIKLPSGHKATESNVAEVLKYFNLEMVKGVTDCSLDFLSVPIKAEQPINMAKENYSKKKTFIVHGRDKAPALELKDYLKDTYALDVVVFDDIKRKKTSPTIIEILEYIMSNAGYAFIVATPDDLGSYRKDIEKSKEELLINPETINVKSILTILSKFKTRARQNVVFEHGLFIGALGRDRVCCLLQADTQDKQTDIDGIVYVCFKENVSETFPEIVEKLKDPKIGLIKP
jgi:predicted nucleotide-binding protein